MCLAEQMKSLINKMASELVEVHVFTLGGSNTNTATDRMRLLQDAQNTDIMINGYSTNIMHIKTIEAAGEDDTER
jgi:proteasome assembly chaperone (PAC2) family protein